MKLELKHLAFYLPYGLKVQHFIDENIRTLTTSIHTYTTDKIGLNYLLEHDRYTDRFKPILRPLSDITKLIEHNGEKFYPFDRVEYGMSSIMYNGKEDPYFKTEYTDELQLLGDVMPNILQLLEWHFDVFGLIEAGLAIDINTINQ